MSYKVINLGTWTFVKGDVPEHSFGELMRYALERHQHCEVLMSMRLAREYEVTYAWGVLGIRPPSKKEVTEAFARYDNGR